MTRPEQWQQGSIVLARVVSPRGQSKVRPLLIVTPRDRSILNQQIVAVAITTTFPSPPPDGVIELPWDARWPVATGLRRRSAAVCDWLVRLHPGDILAVKGFTPAKTLLAVLQRIAPKT